MKPPVFQPPYDSPIETEFARAAVKYLAPDVNFIPQFPVDTLCGRFILDFVAVRGNRRVGFECDGAEYHDASYDEWRDAMILGDDRVDVIIRLRGTDIHKHMEDCLHLIARKEPTIFSERGRMNLRTLTVPKFRDLEWPTPKTRSYWNGRRSTKRTRRSSSATLDRTSTMSTCARGIDAQ